MGWGRDVEGTHSCYGVHAQEVGPHVQAAVLRDIRWVAEDKAEGNHSEGAPLPTYYDRNAAAAHIHSSSVAPTHQEVPQGWAAAEAYPIPRIVLRSYAESVVVKTDLKSQAGSGIALAVIKPSARSALLGAV